MTFMRSCSDTMFIENIKKALAEITRHKKTTNIPENSGRKDSRPFLRSFVVSCKHGNNLAKMQIVCYLIFSYTYARGYSYIVRAGFASWFRAGFGLGCLFRIIINYQKSLSL